MFFFVGFLWFCAVFHGSSVGKTVGFREVGGLRFSRGSAESMERFRGSLVAIGGWC